MKTFLFLTVMGLGACALLAQDFPGAEIASRDIRAKLYLPDAARGFYRGTRFDWSGVIHSLQYGGHDYYGPWFQKTDPKVHDFIYDGADIVAGPCSGITGPVDEFGPVGYADAKPGGRTRAITTTTTSTRSPTRARGRSIGIATRSPSLRS